jgi:hypothetical protein
MKLNELSFYKPLIWAIEKYCMPASFYIKKLPNGEQEVNDSCPNNFRTFRTDVTTSLHYVGTDEGFDYWSTIHDILVKIYKTRGYFSLLLEDYKKNNKKQLDFDFYENEKGYNK